VQRNATVRPFRPAVIAVLVCLYLGYENGRVFAQILPPADDSGLLHEAILGVLPAQANVPAARAQKECIILPVKPANDRLQGPRGDSLVSTHCEVIAYQTVLRPPRPWIIARYRWISLFTAEDKARGPAARDAVTEEEVVLFDVPRRSRFAPSGTNASRPANTPSGAPLRLRWR
jgi:hypothetical protein